MRCGNRTAPVVAAGSGALCSGTAGSSVVGETEAVTAAGLKIITFGEAATGVVRDGAAGGVSAGGAKVTGATGDACAKTGGEVGGFSSRHASGAVGGGAPGMKPPPAPSELSGGCLENPMKQAGNE